MGHAWVWRRRRWRHWTGSSGRYQAWSLRSQGSCCCWPSSPRSWPARPGSPWCDESSARSRSCPAERRVRRPDGPDRRRTAFDTKKPAHAAGFLLRSVEATTGFEPVNRGFADLRVEPLHHVAPCGSPNDVLAAPRGFEPRFTDPKSAVLPLDEGAAVRGGRSGAEDGTRTRDPHLGKVMLYQLSHFRSIEAVHR